MKERTLMSFDWAIKSILRQKDNFDILEGFLTDLLCEKIEILDLLESESNKDSEYSKMNRVDLKAKDSLGREIIIEIQNDPEPDYMERVYYGACKSLVDNMKEGYKYKNIKKIISISIVYFPMIEDSYLIKGEVQFKDMTKNNREIKLKSSQKVFADYYFIQPKGFEDKISALIDEWVFFFKHSSIKGDMKATNMDKVGEKLDKLKMTPDELRKYEYYQFNKTINDGVLQVKYDTGLEAGMKQGIEKGLQQGVEQGKQLLIENLRRNGMSEEDILKYTK